ncbi:CGNR zinc finger domain-containing protein [Actinokineospora auranticolor]|uniref:Putative RNA-binding Zn ribbon-like protein n=1 Tax=Actinokineospora auranticolor TaxID=155976 RepID=A0A2S6GTM6_9PSEU|nr:CGNR zinc finger domain-containing protein [Actinokineospora auranticolor]PPK68546.1 putative RNA-binding Zn ribbon-like protein [Actinokineospora auranticolor]
MRFDSHYDGPVRAAAHLVNAVTTGQARGRAYAPPDGTALRDAVAEALRTAGAEDLTVVTAAAADRLRRAATTLRGVFAAVADDRLSEAATLVNDELVDHQVRPVLLRHDDDPTWHVHQLGTVGGLAGQWAGTCAAALSVVIGGPSADRLGVCTAPRCDRVYVDTSHNGSRRFCSTACQNRVKTAAYRARAT